MLIFIYLIFSFFLLLKYKISTPVLFIYSGLIFIFGILTFNDDAYVEYLYLNLSSNLLILIGFFTGKRIYAKSNYMNFSNMNYKGILYFFFLSVFLLIVHYSIIGIPILSSNFDVDRFTLASSGYGGIPSRIATYTPMLFFFIWILINDKKEIKNNIKILFFIYVLLALFLQGHKSSVLQIFYGSIIAYQFIINKYKIKIFSIFILLLAFIFAYFSFKNLSTLDDLKLFNYLFDRYTIILHQPGFILSNLSKSEFVFFSQSIILSDVIYPILKLLSFDIQTLNDQLSRIIYGIRYKDDFSVPVTPGWFSYHYFVFDYSFHFTLIYSFFFGAFLSIVETYGLKSKDFAKKIVTLYILYFSYVGYSTGNIYYLIINITFCVIVFLLFYFYKSPIKK